ncbi:MAG: hypothetical protein LBJ08_04120, partial [Bifidobacteriaceae bacterium]|nr:hypothetical protein [Bifidobacteriaceae bacterium]
MQDFRTDDDGPKPALRRALRARRAAAFSVESRAWRRGAYLKQVGALARASGPEGGQVGKQNSGRESGPEGGRGSGPEGGRG